jgi:hypothetical protein
VKHHLQHLGLVLPVLFLLLFEIACAILFRLFFGSKGRPLTFFQTTIPFDLQLAKHTIFPWNVCSAKEVDNSP